MSMHPGPGDALRITGSRPLRGTLRLPGEKGMSHRALLFAALADGTSTLEGLAPGDDVRRTAGALHALGVDIAEREAITEVSSHGVESLTAPGGDLDCGNSGTTMRMLTGLLAARPFTSVLTGDESLRSRPMARVVTPLRKLGADVTSSDGGAHAPLTIEGTTLTGARVELAVASGQVKTALALAGLQADGTTEIVEPAPSRDHTERMLIALGAPVTRPDGTTVRVTRGEPETFQLMLPGDPSSAAFFAVGAAITEGSDVTLTEVLVNPGRVQFVDVLRAMGADIELTPTDERLGEPVGDLHVRSGPLRAASVEVHESMIDEVPVLAVAAAFAEGSTVFRGVAELRVKESDRVVTVVELLDAIGARAEADGDSLVVHGGEVHPADMQSHGDHRIALAGAVAACAIDGPSSIAGWSATAVSYPDFERDLEALLS
jgi:3-phosphoshikimate 1-carboxyvinyltransferase